MVDKASIHSCLLFLIFFFSLPMYPLFGADSQDIRERLIVDINDGQDQIKPSTHGRSGKGRGCV